MNKEHRDALYRAQIHLHQAVVILKTLTKELEGQQLGQEELKLFSEAVQIELDTEAQYAKVVNLQYPPD